MMGTCLFANVGCDAPGVRMTQDTLLHCTAGRSVCQLGVDQPTPPSEQD